MSSRKFKLQMAGSLILAKKNYAGGYETIVSVPNLHELNPLAVIFSLFSDKEWLIFKVSHVSSCYDKGEIDHREFTEDAASLYSDRIYFIE